MMALKLASACLRWLGVAALLVLASHPFAPHLLAFRDSIIAFVLGAAALGMAFCVQRLPAHGPADKAWARRIRKTEALLLLLALLTAAAFASHHGWALERSKHHVRNDPANHAALQVLGQHFIIGYRDFEEVAPLARSGAIAGIYLKRKHVQHRSIEHIRAEIMALQMIRQKAGLPPLIVAADQEGGHVNHMSPPLPSHASLASLLPQNMPDDFASADPKLWADSMAAVYLHGQQQGKDLAALGINLNFGPVVDLLPSPSGPAFFDSHTQLAKRSIAAEPEWVLHAASSYMQGLGSSQVSATLKHFPGLANVTADTHHFSARLTTPLNELQARDWVPFQQALPYSQAIMLSHIVVEALDAQVPASMSKAVAQMIKQEWGYQGLLITDDISMGAVYYPYGVCQTTITALNAGVDMVLISYDPDQYYLAMDCAIKAMRQGTLRMPIQSGGQKLAFLQHAH